MKDFALIMVSLTNLSLGGLSLFLSIQGMFLYAAYLMIAAAALDLAFLSASGISKSGEVFTKDLNNISKALSFSVAPAVFSYMILYRGLEGYLSYVFLILPMAMIVSGLVRTARLNSGRITSWNGMRATFNVMIPALYILNFFSIFIVAGWMLLSPVFMLSTFSFKGSLKKKKKEKVAELKGGYEEEPKKEETRDEDEGLVPLSIFGD